MSYCRLSSDNFWCDVYCYEDVNGGFTTHVASRRKIRKTKSPNYMTSEAIADKENFTKIMDTWRKEFDSIPYEDIGLSRDGYTFYDDTREGMIETLASLKKEGYVVPDWVFNSIQEEIDEDAGK